MIVLLVDDDDDDVLFFSEALREIFPMAILQRFGNAEEALRAMARKQVQQPHIIFVDVNMPMINGWEFLREVKRMSDWQKIPLVMYSSADLQSSGMDPADVGATAFYQKSDSFESLKDRLRHIITSTLPSFI